MNVAQKFNTNFNALNKKKAKASEDGKNDKKHKEEMPK